MLSLSQTSSFFAETYTLRLTSSHSSATGVLERRTMNMESIDVDHLLRASAVAEWLGTSEGRLANLRSLGLGPAFVKIGHAVRYRRSDIEAYLEANTVWPCSA
jgi:predicted DNA-binding transcriptional regulator AlpA